MSVFFDFKSMLFAYFRRMDFEQRGCFYRPRFLGRDPDLIKAQLVSRREAESSCLEDVRDCEETAAFVRHFEREWDLGRPVGRYGRDRHSSLYASKRPLG